MIDFAVVNTGQRKLSELADGLTFNDLRMATNEQIDLMLGLIQDLSDAQTQFVASDPKTEDGVGWNVAHLIAHVTASSEEGAAFSSILARGIDMSFEPRLRVEADWTTLQTAASCIQRLEESRRIRLGYLSTWPDEPHFDTHRELPDSFAAFVGPMNAVGCCLLGLWHEVNQFDQLRDIIAQAQTAVPT